RGVAGVIRLVESEVVVDAVAALRRTILRERRTRCAEAQRARSKCEFDRTGRNRSDHLRFCALTGPSSQKPDRQSDRQNAASERRRFHVCTPYLVRYRSFLVTNEPGVHFLRNV